MKEQDTTILEEQEQLETEVTEEIIYNCNCNTETLVDVNTNLANISYTLNCTFCLAVGIIAAILVYKFVHRFF